MNKLNYSFGASKHGSSDTDRENVFVYNRVVYIRRVNKTVKGGRNLSFFAMSVSGNKNGSVGLGIGKARTISSAIEESFVNAKLNIVHVSGEPMYLKYKFCATEIILIFKKKHINRVSYPVGEVFDAAGISNVSCKILRSRNTMNVLFCVMAALRYINSLRRIKLLRTASKNRENIN